MGLSNFHVGDLPPAVTSHPLWEGSILQQKHALGLLTWADLHARVNPKTRPDDTAADEKELWDALEAEYVAWNKQWEFD